MRELKIYTDGSHLKHTTGRLGTGGILVEGNQAIDKFSMELTTNYLQVTYGTSDVSNPTCEMLAVLVALGKFKNELKTADKITVFADYNGVMYWLTNKWKITKPYIQRIKDDINDEIYRQGLKGKIFFEWVKGHQTGIIPFSNAYWNSLTDLLAKGEDNAEL